MLLLKLLLLTVVKNKSMKHEKMNGAKAPCHAKEAADCSI